MENKLEDTILTSFYHESIKMIKELDPSINAGIIFTYHPVNVSQMALNANTNIIFPNHKYMTADLIEEAKNIRYLFTLDHR